ncbi:uncharacterized protein LOC120422252 isoform X2 [Culex pipiens pallens]|uniref:uncharacterized protein LOC120422252 isoform X2 n=1 Tax=Culex pipiens pallens TaxID=42434 RepID=UPI0022AA1CA3|nr:uncharacterized protein LOC120422252 isoform X2 [Culex pipiens pallens]
MTICIVPGCGNSSQSGWNFFSVPMTKSTVFKKWTNFMNLSGNRTERICSSHFEESDFKTHSRIMLRHNAVPTLRIPDIEPFYSTTGSCCVWGCKTKQSGLLTPFPSNPHYRIRWMDVLNMPKETTTTWMRVCQKHFKSKDFVTVNSVYLKPSAIPSKRVKRVAQNPRKLNRSTEVQASGSAQAESKPKSHRICSVFNCTSRSGNGIFLHSFPPKSDDRYVIWIHNLRQGKRPSSNYKVCNKHFTPSDYTKGL